MKTADLLKLCDDAIIDGDSDDEDLVYYGSVARTREPVLARALREVLTSRFDFRAHLAHQAAWSESTFGPGARVAGVCDHIRKELAEVEADAASGAPTLPEWIDVVILALDGAWRSGASPDEIIAALVAKQTRNEKRQWPDWRTAPPDKAIEHARAADEAEGGE